MSTCLLVFELPLIKRKCRIYLSQNSAMPMGVGLCSVFETPDITYDAFCDDFGPMNFLSIVSFVNALDEQVADGLSDAIVYSTRRADARSPTPLSCLAPTCCSP